MRRRWVIGLLVCVAVAAVVWFCRSREPRYNGRSLSEWLVLNQKAWDSGSPTGSPEAVEAVRHIGVQTLPWLVKWARYDEPAWKTKLYYRVSRWPPRWRIAWLERYLIPERPDRPDYMAGNGFMILGEQASPAIPELEKMIHDYRRRHPCFTAIFCLGWIGKDSQPVLMGLSQDPDKSISAAAKRALALRRKDP